MGKVFKVHGPPGTGKTRRQSDEAQKLIELGAAGPSDIAFCSFTRAAAMRSRASVAERTGKDPEDFEWVGTMHRFCRKLLDQKSENKVESKHLKPMFESLHVPYKPPRNARNTSDDIYADAEERPTDKGGWFLNFWDWFRSVRWRNGDPIPKADHTVRAMAMQYPGGFAAFRGDRLAAAHTAVHCWQTYEDLLTSMGLWDFSRLIEDAIEYRLKPPCRVLMVDECQDLSPMLWHLARQWSEKMAVSWFAGDPFQAIYAFAGARPELFREFPAEEVFLSQCHRFGNDRIALAKAVLRGDPSFRDFEWIGKDGGENGYVDGSFARICRTRSLVDDACQYYRERGEPYASNRARTLIGSQAAQAVFGALALAQDGVVTMGELAAFVKIVPVTHAPWLKHGVARKEINRRLNELGPNAKVRCDDLPHLGIQEALRDLMLRGEPWAALSKIDKEDQTYFRLVASKYGRQSLIDQPKRFVTTIHGAKGLEWDGVTTELSWATVPYANYQERGRGEECRIGYVGVTRARFDQGWSFMGGNCFPPLRSFAFGQSRGAA